MIIMYINALGPSTLGSTHQIKCKILSTEFEDFEDVEEKTSGSHWINGGGNLHKEITEDPHEPNSGWCEDIQRK